ncbi:hypothetical protein Taro_021111 [Colocasia esculenta]|uniref:Uncharacterized protein n=1 Tax=Colocasia esculenta TaxID=4460 RepID=A0A843VAJ0_COLES|nr:hypothetical protein [Colocasia esculenta]
MQLLRRRDTRPLVKDIKCAGSQQAPQTDNSSPGNLNRRAPPVMIEVDKRLDLSSPSPIKDTGHFLLTDILLEKMVQTAGETGIEGRIVNVSSVVHSWVKKDRFHFYDMLNPERNKKKNSRMQTKREMSRRGTNLGNQSNHRPFSHYILTTRT